jgi:myo-inositol-1(or 4)-monophosphatase
MINIMDGAARKAARSLIHDFNEVEHLQVSRKGPADFVSEADRRAESILKRELASAHPEFSLLMEESGLLGDPNSDDQWIVDPLDGTTNFLHAIPHFAISIAHLHKGEIQEGIIFDPLREEVFWAAKGQGAYLNNQRLRVSARTKLLEAVLATGIPFKGRKGKHEMISVLPSIMDHTAGIRRFGSAALDLAYVAAGRYEGFWEFGLSPWDVAAGILLVREAGGLVSEVDGRNDPLNGPSILATNSLLFDPIGRLLRSGLKNKTPPTP